MPEYSIRIKDPSESKVGEVVYAGTAEEILKAFVSDLNYEQLDFNMFYRIYKGRTLILKEGK
jgi:hypothetical protein